MPCTRAANKRARKARSDEKVNGDVADVMKHGKASEVTDSNQADNTEVGAAPEASNPGSHPMAANPTASRKTGTARIASKRKHSTSASPAPEPSQLPASPTVPAKQTQAIKKRKMQKQPTNQGQETEVKDPDTKESAKDEEDKPILTQSAKVRKWKKDWKEWISAPENQSTDQFQRTYNEDLVNVKESAKVYGVKGEELACLPHCPVQNPHGKGFTPMKFFLKADVVRLAFRKEAVLEGESQDDEDELLARGEKLYEQKHG
ncbi:hypothetical protein P171DRAFT_504573 [Karstenula rhodostoma CBS 690.94]|uniref:Uncharacterized protein n=1 Tax=Karstenula rhodostoma CBS 690.94 TaxID=1392251 RepID=A0A9P4U6V3_9PLEO|nr:hypothetical protein P171DRAFT_504573 [Karstenula rhodostoma CBS 690.94]